MKALVVDDDRDVVELIALFLVLAGWEVVSAQSGEEALGLVTTVDALDLCIIDFWMYPVAGADVRARVEQMLGCVPVLYITGDDPARLCFGGAAVLRKPFNQHELLAAVKRTLDDRRALA